ncbi:MAG: hypothetical protein PVG53_03975 [Holophagae bacterium]
MEITIAVLAGVVSSLLLAAVYLADRYEREPIELIQDSFLVGLIGQLALILARWTITGEALWTGPWPLVTLVAAAVYLPQRLAREPEVDERFDGIVYAVATLAGAVCAMLVNDLPWLAAASPHRAALAPGAEPDLRDLVIVATGPELGADLGRGAVLVLAAVLIGAVLGVLQLRGTSRWPTTAACVATAALVGGLDLALGGASWWRWILAATAAAAAVTLKHRSVFRDRPQVPERDVVVLGLKTVMLVLGAALLATALLRAVVEQPSIEPPDPPDAIRHPQEFGR